MLEAGAQAIMTADEQNIPQGYDEGPCRKCGAWTCGLAYDVAGLCAECAAKHKWSET